MPFNKMPAERKQILTYDAHVKLPIGEQVEKLTYDLFQGFLVESDRSAHLVRSHAI